MTDSIGNLEDLEYLEFDLLKKRYSKKKESYWIERDKPIGTMKRQF